jgi:membrane associated rhomboid family serine protease
MENENHLSFKTSMFVIPAIFVGVIWSVYWFEIQFGFNFNKFGVYPRDLVGLRGVFFTHFIHSDTNHLFNNSIPLFVLLSSLFYFYKQVAYKVLCYGGLLTGLLTWMISRESYHIGASGIVYLLFSFVFFSGIIRKHYRLVALSLIIIFLYGSMVWYVLPIKDGMSWEGHLSGFLVGGILSLLYRNKGIVNNEYQFSPSEIDDFFDENGNLIEDLNETV